MANGTETSLATVLAEVEKDVNRLTDSDGTLTGVPTGLTYLDHITGGWNRSDLVIIAARPGMGKTAFALKEVQAAAAAGYTAGIISLEMSNEQLVKRLISIVSPEIHSNMMFRTGMRDAHGPNSKYQQAFHEALGIISAMPIVVDDRSTKLHDIIARARKWKKQNNLGLLVIDYLQLIDAGDGLNRNSNREQEVSLITRKLKQLAKMLDIPVLALSQLSRKVEERPGKRPKLSDLRESGAIEQDADLVAFLYRAEYYGIKECEDGMSSEGVGEIEIAKQRNGGVGIIRCNFDSNRVLWHDREIHHESPQF